MDARSSQARCGSRLCIAAVHPLRGQIGNADEVVKIELRHRAPDRKQGMPPTSNLPVDGQVGLQKLELTVLRRVSADG